MKKTQKLILSISYRYHKIKFRFIKKDIDDYYMSFIYKDLDLKKTEKYVNPNFYKDEIPAFIEESSIPRHSVVYFMKNDIVNNDSTNNSINANAIRLTEEQVKRFYPRSFPINSSDSFED